MIKRNENGIITEWTFTRGKTPDEESANAIKAILAFCMGAGESDLLVKEIKSGLWLGNAVADAQVNK